MRIEPEKIQQSVEKAIAFVRDNQQRLAEMAAEPCDPLDPNALARITNARNLLRLLKALETNPNDVPARAQIMVNVELWHIFHSLQPKEETAES